MLEELSRKRERERERAKALQEPGKCNDPLATGRAHQLLCLIGMSLDPEKQIACRECGAKDLDDTTRRVFGIFVCKKCMRELPNKYSLLTKTEAKEVSITPVPDETTRGQLRTELFALSGLPSDRL